MHLTPEEKMGRIKGERKKEKKSKEMRKSIKNAKILGGENTFLNSNDTFFSKTICCCFKKGDIDRKDNFFFLYFSHNLVAKCVGAFITEYSVSLDTQQPFLKKKKKKKKKKDLSLKGHWISITSIFSYLIL